MFEVGYTNFVVTLFLLSGGIALIFDVKIYKRDQLKKEMKAAHWLGWINVGLGLIIFFVNWGYYKWFV
jgi:uncharacterized membrane protein